MRYVTTVFGIITAVGLLVMSLAGNDSMNYFLDKYYSTEQRYGYQVTLTRPVRESELLNISRLDGVVSSEPLLQIPVRLYYHGQSQDKMLTGLVPYGTMKQPVDITGRKLALPDSGLLMDSITARQLEVRTGDCVQLKTILPIGPSHQTVIQVVGIADESMGGEEYVSFTQANHILGEGDVVTGIILNVDPGKATSVEQALNGMTNVSSISDKKVEAANLRNMMTYSNFFEYIMAVFALILGFFVVFNAFLMVFAERSREMALLRVIGFSTS
jgi:putative ABC transport system permease protein